VKRSLDVTAAAVALLLLSPFFLAAALLIKASSPGPVFYTATRIGRHGVPFRLYKFRTMRPDADRSGPAVTRHNDDRITSIGRFLRKTKLDELPQLLNILKGEMSLVGPRPEAPYYVDFYTPAQRQVLSVPPGFTSLASIRYRNEEALLVGDDWERIYLDEIMPDKLRIDARYLENWSLDLDLRILLYTVLILPSVDSMDFL
jgi:lipopolysaccharide/colanic/teichoic acid biosynthesis glycosyltransferase